MWVRLASIAVVALLAMLGAFMPQAAVAQTVTTYTQTTTGTINGNTTCAAPRVRTVNVGTSYLISKVTIGILATHSWRGDLQFTLESPSGTRVQLTNGDTQNMSGNNFNALLDDAAPRLIGSDSPTGNHPNSAPPYQDPAFRPQNPLSAFNNEQAFGQWRLEICDLFPGADNGSFQRFDLNITSQPEVFADLSLAKTRIGGVPSNGGSITWRLTVNNASNSTNAATGVVVRDYLPAGFTFISASGAGSFDGSTGIWTVGTVNRNQSRSIDITGSINATAGASITNAAEITASSVLDADSTVNNGIVTEDDYATNTFTVAGVRTPGTPPTFSCPAGNTLFDWDARTWAAGSVNNSYPLGTLGTINFALNNPGTWLNSAGLGGQSPNLQSAMNGGFTGQNALIQLVDLPDRNVRVTTTITLPTALPGAQFRVFDVDFTAGQFADIVTVEGRLNGATVLPTLTNGATNYVIGNSAYGDAGSDTGDPDGNVVVTFSQPIDQIIILYGDHALAPVDPGQQAISIGDITFCGPTTTLAVAKTSTVLSDPVNGNSSPKAIPNAILRYCILISNPGAVAANSIIASDPIPNTATYRPGTIKSGTSCAGATTTEDDNAAGPDESDPFGASISGRTITAIAANIAAGQAFAITFEATVD